MLRIFFKRVRHLRTRFGVEAGHMGAPTRLWSPKAHREGQGVVATGPGEGAGLGGRWYLYLRQMTP